MTKQPRLREDRRYAEPIEHEKAREAFAKYVAMGKSRSLKGLAEQEGVKVATINSWSHKFKWKSRIKEISKEAAGKANEDLAEMMKYDASRLTIAKHDVIDRMIKRMDSSFTSVNELFCIWKVIKIELGEPIDIARGSLQVTEESPMHKLLSQRITTTTDVVDVTAKQ